MTKSVMCGRFMCEIGRQRGERERERERGRERRRLFLDAARLLILVYYVF